MIEPITTPGKTYAVTSPNGCTVTTDDGITLAEIEAGKQGYFVAVGGKVQLSDDSAILTQLFKLAPQQKLALLGVLGGGDPAWLKALREELTALLDGSAFELAWLAGKKTLVVHTDRVSDALLAAVKAAAEAAMPATATLVQYNHNIALSWRDINPLIPPLESAKYDNCKDFADLQAVNPNFKNDLVGDGIWAWPLSSLINTSENYSTGIFLSSSAKRIDIFIPSCTKLNDMCQGAGRIETFRANCSHVTHALDTFWATPELRVVDATFDSLVDGYFMFGSSQLDKESTLRILNSIPAYESGSHRLRIAIHVDHKTDDEVLAAIANAEAKGWTMTLEWNGTATAQASVTYGLRKPTIYARISEHDGEQRLDWGHYVTDPTGYEEFRSVEAAREHFGLPEEDLT